VAIDANAHTRNIRTIEEFIAQEEQGELYTIVKICLNPPVDTLFSRVSAREQKPGIHQGTESDLTRDLNSSKKKIHLEEYGLIINTKEVPLEEEVKMVSDYLVTCGSGF
jgi:hypothetical protein